LKKRYPDRRKATSCFIFSNLVALELLASY
jgi:hypothetical protein